MSDLEAEGTDAYRLSTITDGWVERFGHDVLISFKNQAARERLTTEYFLWAEAMGFNTQRMFERLLPKRNEERKAPKLILGDSNTGSRSVVMERGLRFEIDFSGGYSVGLFIDQRENVGGSSTIKSNFSPLRDSRGKTSKTSSAIKWCPIAGKLFRRKFARPRSSDFWDKSTFTVFAPAIAAATENEQV